MRPTALTPAERLKGTLVVLVWLALALVLRDSWSADRPASSGGTEQRLPAEPARQASAPQAPSR